MSETYENRLKRLRMRSMRRGIKEMDLILSNYADRELSNLGGEDLDCYEALLHENDQEIYSWVTGQVPTPERFRDLIGKILSTFER